MPSLLQWRLLLLRFVITRDAADRMSKDTAFKPVSDDEETTLDHTTGAHRRGHVFQQHRSADWSRSSPLNRDLYDKPNSISAVNIGVNQF